eukprot:2367275-Amphidinium_carterae.1
MVPAQQQRQQQSFDSPHACSSKEQAKHFKQKPLPKPAQGNTHTVTISHFLAIRFLKLFNVGCATHME